MATILIALLVACAAGAALWSMVMGRKKGKSLSCDGDCSKCRGCH